MSELAKCPNCGQSPSITVRSRAMNWGAAEMRCSNGCPGLRVGFSFPPGGEAKSRIELKEQWLRLVTKVKDNQTH